MDQHRAHRSKLIVGFLKGAGATVLLLPPGCSELNPIEKVWDWIKRRWRRRVVLCEDKIKSGLPWMEEQIQAICQEAADVPGLIENFAESHFTEIRKILNE